MNFSNWFFRFDELKKVKPTAITHLDIDRWLKSVDGLARDLQDLKKAKERSQSKLNQVKKKFEPMKVTSVEKPGKDQSKNQKPEDAKQKVEIKPDEQKRKLQSTKHPPE